MNQFLSGLGARERVLLIAGGIVLLLMLLYALAWRPMAERADRLRVTVNEQVMLHQWMQSAAAEVQRLRSARTASGTERQSLLSLADSTARQAGLGPAIRRVEPEGADRVRIVLEQAGFDDMVSWLELLVSRHRVALDTVTVDSRPEPGLVNARLVLQAAAP